MIFLGIVILLALILTLALVFTRLHSRWGHTRRCLARRSGCDDLVLSLPIVYIFK